MTQYFQLNIGTEFAFGGGLTVILRRKTGSDSGKFAFECLLDQSCQIGKRNQKNHISMNVVLTSGDYLLQFYDLAGQKYSSWLANDLGLEDIPISVSMEAYPIMQNEER